MKTVKLMSVIVLSLSTIGAQAQPPTPGGDVAHFLRCSTPQSPSGSRVLGLGYSLQCVTRALAPEHNLVGCNLISKVIYPGAKPKASPLKLMSQDAKKALLTDDSKSISVIVNKKSMTAELSIGSSAKSICAEEDQGE